MSSKILQASRPIVSYIDSYSTMLIICTQPISTFQVFTCFLCLSIIFNPHIQSPWSVSFCVKLCQAVTLSWERVPGWCVWCLDSTCFNYRADDQSLSKGIGRFGKFGNCTNYRNSLSMFIDIFDIYNIIIRGSQLVWLHQIHCTSLLRTLKCVAIKEPKSWAAQ